MSAVTSQLNLEKENMEIGIRVNWVERCDDLSSREYLDQMNK